MKLQNAIPSWCSIEKGYSSKAASQTPSRIFRSPGCRYFPSAPVCLECVADPRPPFCGSSFCFLPDPSTISAGPDTLLRGCRSRSCPFHAAPSDPALLHGRNRFTKRLYCSLQRIFRPSSDDDCLPSYPVYPAETEPSCKMGPYQQGNPLSPGFQRKPGAKYSFFLRKKDFIPPRKALASGSFIGVY